MKPDIRSLTSVQLGALCQELGWQRYRRRQLYSWLWQRRVTSFDDMTNIGKSERSGLGERFRIFVPETLGRAEAADGTTRHTFRLCDGAVVESVYIPDRGRRTVCVSTQVGCGLGCRFCNTARLGLTRSLAWHEIAGQALEVARSVPERLTNVVFMGMGEPMANLQEVMTAVAELNSVQGMNIGARRITVSTAGLPDGIRQYAQSTLQSRLAVSLNAADDETRSRLMPVNRRHPLAELMSALREYVGLQRKRITFEYVLLRGENDKPGDARSLARLLKGIPCKVNLIPFNPYPDCEFVPPRPAEVERFAELLYPLLPAVTIRRSRGAAVNAACGQLAASAKPD